MARVAARKAGSVCSGSALGATGSSDSRQLICESHCEWESRRVGHWMGRGDRSRMFTW